jgi:alkylated DNA nucleotide flippase Atl1
VDREEYVEAVLAVVERIPSGRVTTYGAIADAVGTGGPRQVGSVMANYGGPVPWWRVVRADGVQPACHDGAACQEHLAEGTPLLTSGRVDMRAAFWEPPALNLRARTSPPASARGGSGPSHH